MSSHTHSLRPYWTVFLVLLGMTVLTVAAAFVDLGAFNNLVALGIAGTKALLVILWFMHVRESSGLTKVFAGVGFLFLLILLVFVFGDYLSRTPVPPAF